MARKPTDTVSLMLRMPERLRRRIEKAARDRKVSLNREVVDSLARYLDNHQLGGAEISELTRPLVEVMWREGAKAARRLGVLEESERWLASAEIRAAICRAAIEWMKLDAPAADGLLKDESAAQGEPPAMEALEKQIKQLKVEIDRLGSRSTELEKRMRACFDVLSHLEPIKQALMSTAPDNQIAPLKRSGT